MLKAGHIAAIVVIYLCTCLAWVILGFTVFERTAEADASLRDNVVSTWGAPHEQTPPTAHYQEAVGLSNRVRHRPLRLDSSDLHVDLGLNHRQKGLLWYSTYRVDFQGDYTFFNPHETEPTVWFRLALPAENAVYDSLTLKLNGEELELKHADKQVKAGGQILPGETGVLSVSYSSQGLDSWAYVFGHTVTSVKDFKLALKTDFTGVDFAENSLSPTDKAESEDGWQLQWNYENMLSGYRIQVDIPEKLQPGPLAGRISFFAPVSLLFFFFVLFMVTTLKKIELHPMNYFFLAAAFFAFHLLLAYLADHVSIHAAFAISSAVSLFLVISYLRLVVGARFAALEAGGAQFLYLVLFSYAFFFEGVTGLTITVGSILTLFVAMQLTGRVRWASGLTSVAGQPEQPVNTGGLPGSS
jgi:inner membrane protein CreD